MVSAPTKAGAGRDIWDNRFTSPAPWEHADVSTYDGLKFAQAIERRAKEAARARADLPERQYYHPIRKTYLSDPHLNPQLRTLGLDGQYYDYEKDDYYAWRNRGLRWSKTRRFPKSRWTKDWDHHRDKLLGHRPVGKQYDTEGLGSKETIRYWLRHSNTGYFRGRDRQDALEENLRSVTAPELGPGSYQTENLWRPKGVYCGMVKPSACFESQSRRDVVRAGFKLTANGGGPRNPPKELYVSSEEERMRVQRQLLHSRLHSSLGKPAPTDWCDTKRGFSFQHQRRVTTAEQPAIDAFARSKRYIRVSLDDRSRMEAMAHGARIPAAIIVPTTAAEQDLTTCPTDEQPDEQEDGFVGAEVSQLPDSQDSIASNDEDGSFAVSVQPSRAATAATSVRSQRTRASSSASRLKRPSTVRTHGSRSRQSHTRTTTASSSASCSSSSSSLRRRMMAVQGGPPPSSCGSRSVAAIDLFRQANDLIQPAQQPPVVLPQTRPAHSTEASLSATASVTSAASGSAGSTGSGFFQLALQRVAQSRGGGGSRQGQPQAARGEGGRSG